MQETLPARALRRPQLSSGGFGSCSGASSSQCISQRLLFPRALRAVSGGSGTSARLGVFFLVPVCRHWSSQFMLRAIPHRTGAASPVSINSFGNSGALYECAQRVETPSERTAMGRTGRCGAVDHGAARMEEEPATESEAPELSKQEGLMRKSLRGNDSVVWKEWAPAGPIPGRGGEPAQRGPGGEGEDFLFGPATQPATSSFRQAGIEDGGPQAGNRCSICYGIEKSILTQYGRGG